VVDQVVGSEAPGLAAGAVAVLLVRICRPEAIFELLDEELGCIVNERLSLLGVDVGKAFVLDLAGLAAVPRVRLAGIRVDPIGDELLAVAQQL